MNQERRVIYKYVHDSNTSFSFINFLHKPKDCSLPWCLENSKIFLKESNVISLSPPLYLSPSPSLAPPLSLSLSLTLIFTHTHTHTRTHTHTYTYTHKLILFPTRKLDHTHTVGCHNTSPIGCHHTYPTRCESTMVSQHLSDKVWEHHGVTAPVRQGVNTP